MKEKSVSLGLIVLGSALLAWSAARVAWNDNTTLTFIGVFMAATVPLLFARVRLTPQMKAYAMDDVSIYAMLFITGATSQVDWTAGAWALFLASLLYETFYLGQALLARGWGLINKTQVFFHFTNPFAKVVYYCAAGATYALVNGMGGDGEPFLGSWQNAMAIALTIVIYMLVTMAVDIADVYVRTGAVHGLVDLYSTLYLHIVMMAPLSIIMALFWLTRKPAMLLLIAPIAIMHTSMQAVRSILDEAQRTIEAMAAALEERDQYTAGHSERVARFSGAIARTMGLPGEEVRRVENAGRIHDLGKIDIPDAILRKPSCLDEDEYDVMKTHTDRTRNYFIKYSKLGKMIPFDIAACHHERYDGAGYVYGLVGEEIPLGARILSVADTWDAMTSDRPYRRGLGDEEALRRLRQGSGTQFDPKVVEAFMRTYEAAVITQVLTDWREQERLRQEERRERQEEARLRKAALYAAEKPQ